MINPTFLNLSSSNAYFKYDFDLQNYNSEKKNFSNLNNPNQENISDLNSSTINQPSLFDRKFHNFDIILDNKFNNTDNIRFRYANNNTFETTFSIKNFLLGKKSENESSINIYFKFFQI